MRDHAPLVFFDLDGVLVDSRSGISTCLNATLAHFDFATVSPASIAAVIGPPLEFGFAQLIEEQGGRAALAPDCVAYFRLLYREAAIAGTVIQAGVFEMLTALAAHATLGVATSKPLRFAEPILRHLGIRDFFDVVAGPTPDTDGESKTRTLQRSIALVAERSIEIDLAATFMLGDRSHDMLAAVATGVVPLGAAWGFGSEAELRAAGAALIVYAPSDVPPLILAAQAAS